MLLAPLLFVKVLVARYYKTYYSLLMPIGLVTFVLSFVLVAIALRSVCYPRNEDAKSLARMHLSDLNDKIKKAVDSRRLDDTTRAHLIECRQRITKTLDSNYTANEL